MEQSPFWEAIRTSFNKFPEFCGTWSLNTVFTSFRLLSLSWGRSIQPMRPSHFLNIHFNIILPPIPGSFKLSLSATSPPQNFVCNSPVHLSCHMPRPSHSSWLITRIIFGEEYVAFSIPLLPCSLLDSNIFLGTLFSNTFSLWSFFNVRVQASNSHRTTRK